MIEHLEQADSAIKRVSILFIFNEPNRPDIKPGTAPRPRFSNDLNLVYFAHEALRLGLTVWFTFSDARGVWSPPVAVKQVLPTLITVSDCFESADKKLIVMTASQHLLPERGKLGAVQQVLIEAAVHEVEVPAQVDELWASRYRKSISNADTVVTQNKRMAELIRLKVSLLTGKDRVRDIRIVPLGIVHEDLERGHDHDTDSRLREKQSLGISPSTKVIVNAGGIWDWTDFDTLLEAWGKLDVDVVKKLMLLLPGLGQPGNSQHVNFHSRIKMLLGEMSYEHRDRIILSPSWEEGTKLLPSFLLCADVGLSINRPGIEDWQSHRLRAFDYLKFRLPMITTGGDELSQEYPAGALFKVQSGNVGSYLAVLKQIAEMHPDALERSSRDVLIIFRKQFCSMRTHAPLLQELASAALQSDALAVRGAGVKSKLILTLRYFSKTRAARYVTTFPRIKRLVRRILAALKVYD